MKTRRVCGGCALDPGRLLCAREEGGLRPETTHVWTGFRPCLSTTKTETTMRVTTTYDVAAVMPVADFEALGLGRVPGACRLDPTGEGALAAFGVVGLCMREAEALLARLYALPQVDFAYCAQGDGLYDVAFVRNARDLLAWCGDDEGWLNPVALESAEPGYRRYAFDVGAYLDGLDLEGAEIAEGAALEEMREHVAGQIDPRLTLVASAYWVLAPEGGSAAWCEA